MRNWKGFIAIWAMAMMLGLPTIAFAQEPATPEEEPVATPEPQDEERTEGMPFALYVGVAAGSGSSDDLRYDIRADDLNAGLNELSIDDQTFGKAVIGWKLPHQKGDFRFVFQGFREEEYEMSSVGASARGLPGDDLVAWWGVNVDDGDLTSVRNVPLWDDVIDELPGIGNGDGLASFGGCGSVSPDLLGYQVGGVTVNETFLQCGEVLYDQANPDRVVTGTLPDDLQNRINTYDVVYGREFGGRRYSSRWWAGMRYFEYEGNILAGAWLNIGTTPGATTQGGAGEHFTDGAYLPLLSISQETTGFGPVGSWEADFNFFNRALQLFVRAEVAFTYNSMTMDSGAFIQILDEGDASFPAQFLEDRLTKDLDKSTWQDRAELGARFFMKNGLQLELAFARSGFLDIVLMPDLLQAGVTNEDPQTFTQDFVIDSVHLGAGFQF